MALGLQKSSHALVLPVWGNHVAIFQDGRDCSLPMVSLGEGDDAEMAVRGQCNDDVGRLAERRRGLCGSMWGC